MAIRSLALPELRTIEACSSAPSSLASWPPLRGGFGFMLSPAVYVGGLLMLTSTAWLLLTGTQQVRNVGDMARFGATLFQFLAPLQLVLAVFFSALGSASAVAQEKDRRTLVLLLLTNLSNSELVLGKLLASMLNVLVLLAAALPFFMLTALFGGVSFEQILARLRRDIRNRHGCGKLGIDDRTVARKDVSNAGAHRAGAGDSRGLGGAAGRRRTFHFASRAAIGRWSVGLSPWQAVLAAARPQLVRGRAMVAFGSAYQAFVALALALTVGVNLIAMLMVRVWNPSREARSRAEDVDEFRTAADATAVDPTAPAAARSVHAAPGKLRSVWDNPILWREVCTWAYGRKVLVVRLVYCGLVRCHGASAFTPRCEVRSHFACRRCRPRSSPLFVLSLVLVNALAVTSITTERDLGALDLLVGHRSYAVGVHLRQTLGRVLRGQGNAVAARGTVHLFVVAGALSLENLGLPSRRTGRDEPVRRHAGHPRRLDLHQQPQRRGRQPGHRVLSCSSAWPPACAS